MKFIEIEHRNYNKEVDMTDFHSHSFYELYYLIDGERYYYIGSEVYKISKGTLVIIPPYVPHKTEGSVYNRYLISFEKDFLPLDCYKMLDILSHKKLIIFDNSKSKIFLDTLIKLEREYVSKRFYYEYFLKSELIMILSIALRYGETIEFSRIVSNHNKVIRKVIDYINNNLSENLSLNLLSKKFFISNSHLSREFRKEVKQNISQYIVIARINKASKLLKITSYSIQEIAEKTGFKSSNYMNSVFQKHLNISPLRYRKNMS